MYSTLEAIPQESDLGKQVVEDDGKQKVVNSGEIEPVAIEKFYAQHEANEQHRPRQRLRWREIALISVLGSLVILAVVIGGVLGSRSRHTDSGKEMMNPPSQNRNIAALSFVSDSINNTRIYFQDDGGQIMEAVNPTTKGNNVSWSVNGLGFNATNGSAFAAAVSRPGFPFVSHVLHVLEFVLICR